MVRIDYAILLQSASRLADQYRLGHWPEQLRDNWLDAWDFLVATLRGRCPGFSESDYGFAIERGFAEMTALRDGEMVG